MKSSREGRSRILIVVSVLLAGLGLVWAMPEETQVTGDELGNCVLDSRKLKNAAGNPAMEVQIYWDELNNEGGDGRYGTKFIIHVPASDHVELQNYQGDLLHLMQRPQEYIVELFWDTTRSDAYQIITVDGTPSTDPNGDITRYTGTFDSLGTFVEPTYQAVAASAINLDRVRFDSVHRGVTTRFCLENH